MNKINYLEGLRGFAAFIVVINHFVTAFYPALYTHDLNDSHIGNGALELFISNSPLDLLFAGNLAVCLFFTLSGIVLSQKFFITKDTDLIRSYAIKRYPRLFIPVCFTVMLVLLLKKLLLLYHVEASSITKSTFWLEKLWNFEPTIFNALYNSFIGIFFLRNASFNTVFWTMQIELIGSFIVFGLLLINPRIQRFNIVYLLAIVACVFLHKYYYISFIVGIILSEGICNGYFQNSQSRLFKITCLFIGLFLGSYPGMDNVASIYDFLKIPFIKDYMVFYHVVGAIFIMLAVLSSETLKSFFNNNVNMYLGRISFSMYLLHVPMIGSLSCVLIIYFTQYFNYHLSALLSIVISLPVILLCSQLMYRFVDLTSMNLSNSITKEYIQLIKLLPGQSKR